MEFNAGGRPRTRHSGALAPRLEQADAARDRDIEAVDAAVHGDTRELIAGLAREPAQAIALCPQHPGQRHFLVNVMHRPGGLACGAHHPHACVLHLAQCAREIGDGDVGHGISRPAGHLDRGGIEPHRAVPGRDHRMGASGVRDTQTGTEVVRILHAVQHQNERVLFQAVEHIGKLDVAPRGVDLGHHALVPARPHQRIELVTVTVEHARAGGLGLGDELLHAGVLAIA